MSRGAIIYCFDVNGTNYHRITNFAISLIKKYLKLPVTVITNKETVGRIQGHNDQIVIENSAGNNRFYKDRTVPWYNLERTMAYELSPYDETILLDSDYLVYTDNLLELINTKYDFLLHDRAYDLTGRTDFRYADMSMIPIVWATVIVFKKTELARKIFEMAQYIQRNYRYFCDLYRLDFRNYRNDYAFAMALKQIAIFDKQHFIPSAMQMLPMNAKILKINDEGLTYQFNDSINAIAKQDVHVLDKEIIFHD